MYWGATQIPGTWIRRIFVVSGGASVASGPECSPSTPAVPSRVSQPKNSRRLIRRVRWVYIGTSLLDLG
jgi:hypothetical protein